jgi:DNA repair protein RadA/Sms
MSKLKTSFVCNACGAVHTKWAGQCSACGTWDCITEDTSSVVNFTKATGKKAGNSKIEIFDLSEAVNQPEIRINTGFIELNRVLGGGLVEGSAVLIGGEPGVGKSTLLLESAAKIAESNKTVIYITGEESVGQVSMRASRLGVKTSNLKLASATNIDEILVLIKQINPDLVIIDSIQTMFLPSVESAPGTVSQVRFSSHELITNAKQQGFSLVLVGHVTKDGQIAGPRVLEHMVDCVLYFEGDKFYNFRILRAVKNRFGPANELGIFEMSDKGIKEVTNPSALFISNATDNTIGSVIYAGVEGTRPILVEIQALVTPSYMATPRRAVVGWDSNRLAMILAVLQSRLGLKLFDKEVYLNVAGGIKLTEPAADLAVAIAIISALNNKPCPSNTIIFGEVSLSGDVRQVSKTDSRIKEAEKLGFKNFLIAENKEGKIESKSNIKTLKKLSEVLDFV